VRTICAATDLVDGGQGVRFRLQPGDAQERGFAIRWLGRVFAFVNVCPHAGTELDWQPGEFFEEAGLYLVCATHGALFAPDTGRCIAGPCQGERLEPIRVEEIDGTVTIANPTPETFLPESR